MVLNINKPLNWTSFDVVRKVKSLLNIKKVGHAGTLDPLATGVLIVLTEKDTKRQSEFLQMSKEYIFEMALGIVSETYDMEGPLFLKEEFQRFSDNDISILLEMQHVKKAFSNYLGKISQEVPAYSAVKIGGKPLYKYARGKNVAIFPLLPKKEVEIYGIDILDIIPKKEILIMGKSHLLPRIKVKVSCSKGTYIRSLANDVGRDLGVGAVVTELIRTKIGSYAIENSVKIEDMQKSNTTSLL
ncbi:tRNA pseudouridine(55) synthase TruB [Patescibacteria group bacterium]|nr:tRNA pseudouridine(55) synthase TruB [Patescibacteria group bacterium]